MPSTTSGSPLTVIVDDIEKDYLSSRVIQTSINNASMSSSNIDDIWDEPVAHQDDFEAPTRSKRPLFLVESDDDDDDQALHRVARKPPPQQDIDIDALFQDVDEDEFTSLPPALDIEAVRRRAEARHKQAAPPLTTHEILPSSSPPHDTGDRREEGKNKGKDKEGDQKKERRRPAQLNEGRLLGPSGFPQLIKDVKNFRIKGKGHEVHGFFLYIYQVLANYKFSGCRS